MQIDGSPFGHQSSSGDDDDGNWISGGKDQLWKVCLRLLEHAL